MWKERTLGAACCLCVLLVPATHGDETTSDTTPNGKPGWVEVSSDTVLGLYTRWFDPEETEISPAVVTLCRKSDLEVIWHARFTRVTLAPPRNTYYALVKVTDERIFIFSTWNDYHCTFDLRSGKVVERGRSDEVLRRFDSLTPVKLDVIPGRSVGHVPNKEVNDPKR